MGLEPFSKDCNWENYKKCLKTDNGNAINLALNNIVMHFKVYLLINYHAL